MSDKRVHFEINDPAPSESDPQGYSRSACGRDTFDKGASDWRFVTCKQCQKARGQTHE